MYISENNSMLTDLKRKIIHIIYTHTTSTSHVKEKQKQIKIKKKKENWEK